MDARQVRHGIRRSLHTRGRHVNSSPHRWVLTGLFLALFTLATGCATTTTFTPRLPQPVETWTAGRVFNHVLIIVLENQDFKPVSEHPIMAKLAEQGTLFTNFHGLFHPSYPNYLAMVGGTFFGTQGDVQQDIDAKTIADLLEAKQLTWTQYAEGFPGQCFRGSAHKRYVRRHVPFMSFTSIQNAPERCAHVVNAQTFDPHALPHYAFYSPDLDHDGHDTDLETAVTWLQMFLDPLLHDPRVMQDTLIVVTFDESATQWGNNHIYTVFLGPMVRAGYVEERPYDHYSVLRTIEANFGLGTLGVQDAASSPITHVWSR